MVVGELFERARTAQALRDAWQQVLANDSADGSLSVGVQRFRADADDKLAALHDELRLGTYSPRSLTLVEIPKDDGGVRSLHIPPVRDRIVERALADVLVAVIDPLLGPSCYAYRPGLGVADAVQSLAALRDEGHPWVLRTDVDDCFPTVDIARLRRLLSAIVADPELVRVLDMLLGRQVNSPAGTRPVRGLPQGSPLSPMLANLALEHVDQRLRRAGFPVVRYGDDLAVPAHSRAEALTAAGLVTTALEEIGMRPGTEDTHVMAFEEGFVFLGEEFGPRYPPVVGEHRIVEPQRRCVYLAMQGSGARAQAGRLIVESGDDNELLDVPLGHVERIACFGAVGVSAGLRSWAMANGVQIVLFSRRGNYLGDIRASGDRPRMSRLRAQLSAWTDDAVWLPFARAVVEAKLRKQMVLLQRSARRRTDAAEDHDKTADIVGHAAEHIRQLAAMLPDATDRSGLMGLEGAAAKAYFDAVSALMPDGLAFATRSRRPPLDLVNAALSFGYALLVSEAVSASVAAGLEPAAGLLHGDHEYRPSMALDIMEEFRPLVVDQVVLAAARRGELRAEHARTQDGVPGVLLTKAGREVVIGGYERRMLHTARGALPGFAGSLRRHLYRQAQRAAVFIESGGREPWTGLSWR
jgi:CRISPR-associated protein Cas1